LFLIHTMEETAQLLLPNLQHPSLVNIMEHCAAHGLRTMFSAARTCCKLRQAAAVALHSITAVVAEQQKLDSMLEYLDNHGQHIDSIDLACNVAGGVEGCSLTLRELPACLQLSRMHFRGFELQLQPGSGFQGVLRAAKSTDLKQLQISNCHLLDKSRDEVMSASLSQLSAGLQYLSISNPGFNLFQIRSVQALQQLTHLELAGVRVQRGTLSLCRWCV
jgi:hypothetical protein